MGLAGYFESVVFAQDHRVAKPDKGIFEVVERELGVGPEVCVLVGDHPVNDVAGAHGAGWRSVWLDRDGAVLFPDDGPRPTPWWPRSWTSRSCSPSSASALAARLGNARILLVRCTIRVWDGYGPTSK